ALLQARQLVRQRMGLQLPRCRPAQVHDRKRPVNQPYFQRRASNGSPFLLEQPTREVLSSHTAVKVESEGNKRKCAKQFIDVLAFVLLTFLASRPILPGSFLMDDARLVGSDNPLVTGDLTPYSLWFQTDFTLSTFGWWLEHLAFG